MTTAFPAGGSLEHSGSLTGHILAQGNADTPLPGSRTTKVIAVMLLVMAALIAVGLLAAAIVGDTMSRIIDGLING